MIDVDGTLTTSENAIVGEVLWHARVGARPDAARLVDELAARGDQPIYLTARPRAYTELTRQWLASHGFPRGPVILQPGLTLPGSAALTAKTHALARLRAAGLRIAVGIGNRASDVSAYATVGLAADRIWIEDTRAYARRSGHSSHATELRRSSATRSCGSAWSPARLVDSCDRAAILAQSHLPLIALTTADWILVLSTFLACAVEAVEALTVSWPSV